MNFTCNPYNEFKRGPHQKVISYSLYGKDASYYKQLKNITLSVKKLYPGWLVRVYHDNSINTGIICEVECQRDKETNALIDNTDFCNVEELYLNLENLHANKIFNLKYVHAMMWRWFPLYDNFVDTFSSRDSDSFILKRELESVNVWLNSFNIGHIMRDHPQHLAFMLGGMWGFKINQSRQLAVDIFEKITNRSMTVKQNRGQANVKGNDQFFLETHVYDSIRYNSTIHDSYSCGSFHPSQPWPQRRAGNCFVGVGSDCDSNEKKFWRCPVKCRPQQHKNWTTC